MIEQPMERRWRSVRLPERWRAVSLRVGGILLAVAISAFILIERDHVVSLARYGYPGVFLISLASSATVFLPAPGIAVIFASGSVLNPFAIGIVAGLGEALGELTGYLAGASGRAVVADSERYEKLVRLTRRYGLFVVFFLSVIPNPTFDLVGIAAGALRLPVARFLAVCFLGKTIKSTAVALIGAGSLHLLNWVIR